MFEKIVFFNIMFCWFFVVSTPKMDSKSRFFDACPKTSIGWKSLQNPGCAQKNQGSDFKKSFKNRFNDALDEGIAKSLPNIDFDLHLDLPKPPQVPPKSTRGANTWSLERVWFRDAMQVARKSSEGNGGRRL
jgi:hypothetical protein